MGRIARDAAAVWERALKGAEPRWASASLFKIINGLGPLGVSQSVRDALHTLRDMANEDKHEAVPMLDLGDLQSALAVAAAGVVEAARAVPGLAKAISRSFRRRLLITVYDYYAHGDSEITLFPAPVKVPRFFNEELDVFQVGIPSVEVIADRLSALGAWTWEPAAYSELIAQYRVESEDFGRAALFEGNYRDVVALMSSYQHEGISSIHRADRWISVRAATAMACVDLWQPGQPPPSADDLLDTACSDYGLWRERPLPRRIAKELGELAKEVHSRGLTHLLGPRWCPVAALKAQESIFPRDPRSRSDWVK